MFYQPIFLIQSISGNVNLLASQSRDSRQEILKGWVFCRRVMFSRKWFLPSNAARQDCKPTNIINQFLLISSNLGNVNLLAYQSRAETECIFPQGLTGVWFSRRRLAVFRRKTHFLVKISLPENEKPLLFSRTRNRILLANPSAKWNRRETLPEKK